jgi:hypothetical protein
MDIRSRAGVSEVSDVGTEEHATVNVPFDIFFWAVTYAPLDCFLMSCENISPLCFVVDEGL